MSESLSTTPSSESRGVTFGSTEHEMSESHVQPFKSESDPFGGSPSIETRRVILDNNRFYRDRECEMSESHIHPSSERVIPFGDSPR